MFPRIAASGLVLALINLGSGVLGFWLFKLSGGNRQLDIQLPVTMVVGVILAALWLLRGAPRLGVHPGRGHLLSVLGAFPAVVVLFVPLHFVLTGYLTSFANILAIWLMQALHNAPGMIIAEGIIRERGRKAQS